ncbi:MAG: hypothetical protein IRY98_08485 [Alicyclobacillaceae bacterium]|nr:hypothetical protein [Alicyclobacillaceae bacterium]
MAIIAWMARHHILGHFPQDPRYENTGIAVEDLLDASPDSAKQKAWVPEEPTIPALPDVRERCGIDLSALAPSVLLPWAYLPPGLLTFIISL